MRPGCPAAGGVSTAGLLRGGDAGPVPAETTRQGPRGSHQEEGAGGGGKASRTRARGPHARGTRGAAHGTRSALTSVLRTQESLRLKRVRRARDAAETRREASRFLPCALFYSYSRQLSGQSTSALGRAVPALPRSPPHPRKALAGAEPGAGSPDGGTCPARRQSPTRQPKTKESNEATGGSELEHSEQLWGNTLHGPPSGGKSRQGRLRWARPT